MNSISITAYNRPELLARVVDSILENDTTGFTHCFAAIEPAKRHENHKEILRLSNKFEFIEIKFNEINLGVRKNPFELLKKVFNSGSDFNLYLEDDSLLSPDAFDFIRFYMQNPTGVCANLYNYQSTPDFPAKICATKEFCALGVGLSKTQWEKYFQPHWFDEEIRVRNKVDLRGIGGWDWSIRAKIIEEKSFCVTPCLSRSFHIGVHGIHCDSSCYYTQFANHPYSKFKKTEFQEIGK